MCEGREGVSAWVAVESRECPPEARDPLTTRGMRRSAMTARKAAIRSALHDAGGPDGAHKRSAAARAR